MPPSTYPPVVAYPALRQSALVDNPCRRHGAVGGRGGGHTRVVGHHVSHHADYYVTRQPHVNTATERRDRADGPKVSAGRLVRALASERPEWSRGWEGGPRKPLFGRRCLPGPTCSHSPDLIDEFCKNAPQPRGWWCITTLISIQTKCTEISICTAKNNKHRFSLKLWYLGIQSQNFRNQVRIYYIIFSNPKNSIPL